jgi:predicted nuclease of predicted toxin-antitoxin system
VKFLIDAQLPTRLAEFLNRAGHDAVHTVELPDGNRSTDNQVALRADTDGRVVVTKDQDFRDGHLLARSPRQLLVSQLETSPTTLSWRSSSSTSTQSSQRSMRPTSSSCRKTPWRSAGTQKTPKADAGGSETDRPPNRITPASAPSSIAP